MKEGRVRRPSPPQQPVPALCVNAQGVVLYDMT